MAKTKKIKPVALTGKDVIFYVVVCVVLGPIGIAWSIYDYYKYHKVTK